MSLRIPSPDTYEMVFREQEYVRVRGNTCGHEWMASRPMESAQKVARSCPDCKSVRVVSVVHPPSHGPRRCRDPKCAIKGGTPLNSSNTTTTCGACHERNIADQLKALRAAEKTP